MRQSRTRLAIAALAVSAALAAGCGPGELTSLSATQVERLVRDIYPQAEIRVREVQREDTDVLRAPAEFNGADVIFVFVAGEGAWTIAHIEQGGNSYTVEELDAIASAMAIMRDVSNALEAYHEATGSYPLLDDQVGLRELVPEYYPADGALVDAWGEPLRYRLQGDDYIVTSTGPDLAVATTDDIILITGNFVQAQ